MIRRLILENWRNYANADLALSTGTTFVVASNGVGKTSFVEAARWALFGSRLPTNPTRAGADRTSATVEVVLPDQTVLTATRVWDHRKTKPVHELSLSRDGRSLTPAGWEELCLDLYGCNTDLLESLTMPTPGAVDPAGIGLHHHLSTLYRVDDLNAAVVRLTTELKEVGKEIASVKNANAVKAAEFTVLQAGVDTATGQLSNAQKNVVDTERQLQLARQRDEQHARQTARANEQRIVAEEHELLRARVSELLGDAVPSEQAVDLLQQRLTDARSNLDAVRLEIQLVSRRRQDIERDLSGLDSAVDECPTCRRPLDGETREHAHELWRTELAELENRATAATEAEPAAQTRVAALEEAAQAFSNLAQRRTAPEPGDNDEPTEAPPTPEATQNYRAAAEAEALARQAQQQAERALEDAREADENMKRLEGLFAREARFEVAKAAAEATREAVLDEVVGPLAEAINDRWASLFPNRGKVTTAPDGSMSRTVGAQHLSYEAFSTAEGTAAVIIMRLLVAQMTTKARFAWFDEPLEHLDPDVRRNVASLLSRITTDGTLDQVIVTTYEETLARKLNERSPGRTRLLDVRQETPFEDRTA